MTHMNHPLGLPLNTSDPTLQQEGNFCFHTVLTSLRSSCVLIYGVLLSNVYCKWSWVNGSVAKEQRPGKSEKKQWRHVECPREEKKLGTGSISCSVVALHGWKWPCLWDMPKSEEDSWTGAAVWLLLLRRARVNFSGTSSCFEILAPCNACMLLWRFLCVWFEQRTSGGGPGPDWTLTLK